MGKKMIINFIERYFYLICFATYAKEQGPAMFPKSFVAWMDEHKELREMIANGKDKLEWSRQVDQNAVNELRGKISGPDYKEKLGEIVTSLYKISHTTYSDMPRGVIKDTLMRKLTCKTLMEILPGEVVGKIQKEMAEEAHFRLRDGCWSRGCRLKLFMKYYAQVCLPRNMAWKDTSPKIVKDVKI